MSFKSDFLSSLLCVFIRHLTFYSCTFARPRKYQIVVCNELIQNICLSENKTSGVNTFFQIFIQSLPASIGQSVLQQVIRMLENMDTQKLVFRIKQGSCWNIPIEDLICCAIISIYYFCTVHIQRNMTGNMTSPSKAQPCIGDMSKNSPERTLAVLKCLKHFNWQYGELYLLNSELLFLLFIVPLQ